MEKKVTVLIDEPTRKDCELKIKYVRVQNKIVVLSFQLKKKVFIRYKYLSSKFTKENSRLKDTFSNSLPKMNQKRRTTKLEVNRPPFGVI